MRLLSGKICVALALLGSPAYLAAQDTVGSGTSTTGGTGTTGSQSYTDRDDNWDYGWIGLAGLLGLAGLAGRNRDHRHDGTATATHR